MIIPQAINQKYRLFEPYFDKVKETVDLTLLNFSFVNNFAYSSRVKKVESLAEKIETGRYDSWDNIDDFIGAVIIIPNINYESHVLNFLDESFQRIQLKKRGSSFKSSDVFRFDATRFIGRLRAINSEELINKINFEVQIRSAFEHAWSVTTHDLAYKSKSIDWKILRIVAQLKSSVEQLDMITLGANNLKSNIQEHKWPETKTKQKICLFFDQLFERKIIPNELAPKDMSRFSENLYSILKPSLEKIEMDKIDLEIKKILAIIEVHINKFAINIFPMSLSLHQICYGILLKEGFIAEKILKEYSFHKNEMFEILFPECKNFRIKEFKI